MPVSRQWHFTRNASPCLKCLAKTTAAFGSPLNRNSQLSTGTSLSHNEKLRPIAQACAVFLKLVSGWHSWHRSKHRPLIHESNLLTWNGCNTFLSGRKVVWQTLTLPIWHLWAKVDCRDDCLLRSLCAACCLETNTLQTAGFRWEVAGFKHFVCSYSHLTRDFDPVNVIQYLICIPA